MSIKRIVTIEIEGNDDHTVESTMRHVFHQLNQGYKTGFNKSSDSSYTFDLTQTEIDPE